MQLTEVHRDYCRIEDGILYPCRAMNDALQEGRAKGIEYLEVWDFKQYKVSKSMAVIHSGKLPKEGVVANYCPFCGVPIAHHVGGPSGLASALQGEEVGADHD